MSIEWKYIYITDYILEIFTDINNILIHIYFNNDPEPRIKYSNYVITFIFINKSNNYYLNDSDDITENLKFLISILIENNILINKDENYYLTNNTLLALL